MDSSDRKPEAPDAITTPLELRTPRLLLRSLHESDLAAMIPLIGAREVAATTLGIPHPYNEADGVAFLNKARAECAEGKQAFFAIVHSESGEFCWGIGLNIVPAHQRAELGYWLGVPYWGRGYTTEAASAVVAFGFERLKLNKIWAAYFVGNVASKRVLEKIGMHHEGIFREQIRKWDCFVDLAFVGQLASDFSSRK